MEVLPQLMTSSEVGKAKEKVMHHHHFPDDLEEVVEEVVEEALSKRRSTTTTRTISDGSTLTTVSSTGVSASSSSDDVSAATDLDYSKIDQPILEEAGIDNNEEENSVYLDKNEGTGVEWSQFSVKVDGLAGKLNENADIQQVLSAAMPVISGKRVENLTEPSRKEPETAATYELGESDEEVVELEFETAVDKMHTHNDYNMYCPNCSSRITKVVLRRKIRQRVRVPPGNEGPLFGCLSCLSIFVSSGSRLNPLGIFAGRDQKANIEPLQEQPTSDLTVTTSGSTQAAGKGFDLLWFFRKGIEDQNALTSPLLGEGTAEKQPSLTKVTSKGKGFGLFWPFKKKRGNDYAISQPTAGDIEKGPGPSQQIENGNVVMEVHDKPETLVDGMKESEKPELLVVTGMTNTNYQPQETPVDGMIEPKKPELLVVTGMTNTNYQPQGADEIISVPDIARGPSSPVPVTASGSSRSLEIVKSIVYGGLLESMASLSVVSSAAASDATTLNIVTLGLANLVGGLVVLVHNLRDLRFGESNQTNEERYKEELGKKEHFPLHATVAVLSYIICGLIPPVIYGSTFRETNDRDFKMLAVAAASFLCIFILAIAKVYGRGEHQFKTYFKTVLYYLTSAIMASGVAFAVGELAKKLIEQLGWLEPATVEPRSFQSTWASH